MPRKKKLINYAHLNDQHGDLSKCWFVEYSFRLPKSDNEFYRKRVYDGLGAGSAKERYAKAEKMITSINDYLKSGEYLNHDEDYSPVFVSDKFRPENKRYSQDLEKLRIDNVVKCYLEYKRLTLKRTAIYSYRCRVREFARHVKMYWNNKYVTEITNDDMISYFRFLAEEKNLSRCSIVCHKRVMYNFFKYMELDKFRPKKSSPIYDIPMFGKVVDKSPEPYTMEERAMLKAAILPENPYLWLSCEMIYYCAIRPGIELRNLRIKHINPETKTITIPAELAKNNCTEKIHMPQVLLDFMNELHVFDYNPDYYLFGRNGYPSPKRTSKRLDEYFRPYRDALGFSRAKTYYSFKHTGAISAANNGANPFELQAHLRHKSVATTEQYIKKRIPANDIAEHYIDII